MTELDNKPTPENELHALLCGNSSLTQSELYSTQKDLLQVSSQKSELQYTLDNAEEAQLNAEESLNTAKFKNGSAVRSHETALLL